MELYGIYRFNCNGTENCKELLQIFSKKEYAILYMESIIEKYNRCRVDKLDTVIEHNDCDNTDNILEKDDVKQFGRVRFTCERMYCVDYLPKPESSHFPYYHISYKEL